MVLPSGETLGSDPHSRSNTSIGSKASRLSSASMDKEIIAARDRAKKVLLVKVKVKGDLVLSFIQIA
jgi:hypothetical protein